jgi:lauroyl/myristoyl acyltransferase
VIPSETAVHVAHPRWYEHGFNRVELYRLARTIAWLPRATRLRVAHGIGRLASSLMPSERAAAEKTLEIVTGATGPRLSALCRALFAEFAMCFSDLISTNRQSVARLMRLVGKTEGIEHVAKIDAGVVSVTAHVGNWDMAGRLLATHSSRPTHVVVAQEATSALEPWLRRDGDGVRFVSRTRPTVSLELMAALRRGEAVGMQGDRALGGRGNVIVPFFDRPAPFPIGPFRLASAARVPVVAAFCTLARDARYDMTVYPPLVIGRGTEQDALRTWVSYLERVVRERPTQWFNFFDIWNPPGT